MSAAELYHFAWPGIVHVAMSNIEKLLRVLAMVLPQRAKRVLFRRILGWTVADDAYVGLSYLGAEAVTLGPGSRIGHFNIVRNMRSLEFGRRAYIMNFNHIFGCTPLGMAGARTFRLGDDGHVTSRHFFEVGGSITIGNDTLIGGRGTHIYTHSLITRRGVDQWKVGEMVIGDGAKVFARTILVHCRIPPGAIVTAGAVLTKSYDPEPNQRLLIAGNPATIVGRRAIPDASDAPGEP